MKTSTTTTWKPLAPCLLALAVGLGTAGCTDVRADDSGLGIPNGGPGGADDGDNADDGDDGGNPGDDGGDPGDDGGTGDGEDPGDGDTGDGGTEDDPPADCDFAAGCYEPEAPADDIGLASHVPIGCEGGDFEKTFLVNLSSYADPEAPRTLPLLGDFDGDGKPDLVLNMRKASVGFVFKGLGDGSFDTDPSTLPGGLFAGGWGGDIGDIDNDGALDIVLGDHCRSARAWSSAGNMQFVDARTGLPDDVWFNGAGVADLNGDGLLDAIFGADQFSSGYQLYHGDGNGGWTAATGPLSGPSNAGYFSFDDYDGDGDLDIFSFARGSGSAISAYVFRNDGASFPSAAELAGNSDYASSADPVQGSIGDVNCDGHTDVAVGGTIYVGNGTSWTKAVDVDGSHISHLADMNGDGNLDLVTSDPSVGLALYIGAGDGTGWTRDESDGLPDTDYTPSGFAFNTPYGMDIADLDGNGNMDIVRVAGFGSSYWAEAWTR